MPILSDRFSHALQFAFQLHRSQLRKGSGVPYVAHLLGVTAIVLEYGGDEDQAIAALLHDAVEDQGGRPTLDKIRSEYGARVADIVEACSDSSDRLKPAWRVRKERYLGGLPYHSPDILLVSLADKVHNARSILMALKKHGDMVWDRFNGGKSGTVWYYRSLCRQFQGLVDPLQLNELEQIVQEIEEIAKHSIE